MYRGDQGGEIYRGGGFIVPRAALEIDFRRGVPGIFFSINS